MNKGLDTKLERLKHFFDIEEVIKSEIDQDYISKYYLINKLPYSLFHTKEHFVHMGISKGEKYRKDDLFGHVREIDGLIKKYFVNDVLELATGRGGNSSWLAKNNPEVSFTGIDISQTQLSFANRVSKGLENYVTQLGNFEDLCQFNDNSFDLVFIIEALCHSNHTDKVLSEVYRVLKKGGCFVVYDGYREKEQDELSVTETRLTQLLEVGVAVNSFNIYKDFLVTSERSGFKVEISEDLSQYVLPTMRGFEWKAKIFFKLGWLAKFLLNLLPSKFSYNIISGYLFPSLIEAKLFSYKYTLLQKKD